MCGNQGKATEDDIEPVRVLLFKKMVHFGRSSRLPHGPNLPWLNHRPCSPHPRSCDASMLHFSDKWRCSDSKVDRNPLKGIRLAHVMVFSSRSTLILILGVALQHSEAWIAPCPARVGCWGGSGAVQRSNSQSAVKLGATAGVQDSTSGLRPVLLCPAQFGYPPSRLIPSVWRSGCSLLSVLGNLLFVLVAVGECCRFADRAGTARDYISLKADLKERGFALYPVITCPGPPLCVARRHERYAMKEHLTPHLHFGNHWGLSFS